MGNAVSFCDSEEEILQDQEVVHEPEMAAFSASEVAEAINADDEEGEEEEEEEEGEGGDLPFSEETFQALQEAVMVRDVTESVETSRGAWEKARRGTWSHQRFSSPFLRCTELISY